MARDRNPVGNLPPKAARQWEAVYDSAKERGLDSSVAAAQAWCAVKRYYYKKGERWLRRKHPLGPHEQPPGCRPSSEARRGSNPTPVRTGDRFADEHGVWRVSGPARGVPEGWEIYLEHRGPDHAKIASSSSLERDYEPVPRDVEALKQRLEATYPVQLWIHPVGTEAIRLAKIRVDPDSRQQGVGGKVMGAITTWADRNNQLIVLTPEAERGGLSKTALVRWYRTFGFVPNKGRKKDFRFTDAMIRAPRSYRNNPGTSDAARIRAIKRRVMK